MSQKVAPGVPSGMRMLIVVLILAAALTVVGCGGSGGAMQNQQTAQGDTLQTAGGQPQSSENKAYDQALTNFVGKDSTQAAPKQEAPPPPPPAQPSEMDQAAKEMDDLRTENTSLKQKVVKLEEDNRNLTARLSDTETKLASEKDRADKAETMAKSAPAAEMKPAMEMVPDTNMTPYENALKAFNTKMYSDAMKAFQAMLDGGISEGLADNCKYWIGECQYARRKYRDAIASFEEVMKYKKSEKKADAQFMMAQAYERLGEKVKAKEAYEKVVKDYPMSRNVKLSKERWARL